MSLVKIATDFQLGAGRNGQVTKHNREDILTLAKLVNEHMQTKFLANTKSTRVTDLPFEYFPEYLV